MLVHTRCEAEAPCPKVVSQSVACAGNKRIPIEEAAHFLSGPLKRPERRSADEPERGAAVEMQFLNRLTIARSPCRDPHAHRRLWLAPPSCTSLLSFCRNTESRGSGRHSWAC